MNRRQTLRHDKTRLPRIWLMTDLRLGDDLLPAITPQQQIAQQFPRVGERRIGARARFELTLSVVVPLQLSQQHGVVIARAGVIGTETERAVKRHLRFGWPPAF